MTSAEELLLGLRPSRRAAWRAVRGRLWLDHAIWQSGLTPRQFESEHIHRERTASNLMAKWLAEDALPSLTSAKALDRRVPGTLWLFELPLFPLLADHANVGQELRRTTAVWIINKKSCEIGPDWRLPPDADGRTKHYLADTSAFVHRGDLWGLTALVAIMRAAELRGDQFQHLCANTDAFRALPALMRLPWFAPSARSIFDQLSVLQRRMPYSMVTFQADWTTLEALAQRSDYEPDPLKRECGSSSPYDAYPDPIIPMLHIPYKKSLRW